MNDPIPEQPGEMVAGFRGPEACAAARISYRQLDYWCRTRLVEPSVRAAHGSGTQRLYSREDVAALAVVKVLLDAGISLTVIRAELPRLLSEPVGAVELTASPHVRVVVDVASVAADIPEPPLRPAEPQPPTLTVIP